MPVLTMAEIDELRSAANDMVELRRRLEQEGNAHISLQDVIGSLAAVERKIRGIRPQAQPEVHVQRYGGVAADCPFCAGKFLPTPTVGRLECEVCKAMALRGRV